jgi:hypothetical protein
MVRKNETNSTQRDFDLVGVAGGKVVCDGAGYFCRTESAAMRLIVQTKRS